MIITLIGPDGSGKTSVRQRVATLLQDRYPEFAVHEYERRFRLLPTIGRLLGRKPAPFNPKRVVEHKVDHKHPIRSLITVLYYTIEYFAYKVVLAASRSENRTIRLFSRYWHDYYFGFEHTRLPRGLLRVLEWFVPQPDLIIFLDRVPESIRKDKPELPITEIRRQQSAIVNSVFAKRSQFRRVCATNDLQSTAELVLNDIRSCIEHNRCRKRKLASADQR